MCSEEEILNLEKRAQKAVEEAVLFSQAADEPQLDALYEHLFVEEV